MKDNQPTMVFSISDNHEESVKTIMKTVESIEITN